MSRAKAFVVNVGRWRFRVWAGPTRLGVRHGSAGLGVCGVSWLRRSRRD
jgi:hypothetical protein